MNLIDICCLLAALYNDYADEDIPDIDQSELFMDDQPAAEPSVSPSTSPVPGGTCACECGQGTGRSEARAGQGTQRKGRAHRPVGQGPGAGHTVLVRKLARN